jgi:hypothetical protein
MQGSKAKQNKTKQAIYILKNVCIFRQKEKLWKLKYIISPCKNVIF